jgi:hypothetical protein
MPYTDDEMQLRRNLIKRYGEAKGVEIYNKLVMGGKLGEESKARMVARSAEARRG